MKKIVRTTLIVVFVIVATYFGIGSKYVEQIITEVGENINSRVENDGELKELEFIVGKVTRVSDGDTVILIDSKGKKKKIRLDGIDAPEIGQEYGDESKVFVEKLVLNKKVKVKVIGIDKYDRVLGIVYSNDLNVNEELLANGLAWQYHYNENRKYTQLVQSAKAKRLNIWSKRDAQDPYNWRKENK